MKTKPLIDQHIHGAFGVDFNTAAVDDVLYLAREIRKIGVGGIFPTLVTDSIENILDEADYAAAQNNTRYSHDDVFTRLKDYNHCHPERNLAQDDINIIIHNNSNHLI